MSKEDDISRYENAAHAMQSGVAFKMNYNPKETESKHLRVGVNSAMVDCGSLAKLLIDKGLITEGEYLKAIADGMEREAALYQTECSKLVGGPVTLA